MISSQPPVTLLVPSRWVALNASYALQTIDRLTSPSRLIFFVPFLHPTLLILPRNITHAGCLQGKLTSLAFLPYCHLLPIIDRPISLSACFLLSQSYPSPSLAVSLDQSGKTSWDPRGIYLHPDSWTAFGTANQIRPGDVGSPTTARLGHYCL
jgi:hypothetical protein